jgi:Lipocalin-like domain
MSLQDRLPGTYRLVSMETRTTAGHVSRPMGEHPTGMFMFDGSNFCVQLTPTDRGASAPPLVAMFGTYEVDEIAWIFVLTPEGAVDPSLVGTRIVRRVAFDGDLAIFTTPPTLVDGAEATTMITWRRVSG